MRSLPRTKYGALVWMLSLSRTQPRRVSALQDRLLRRLVHQAHRHVPFYRDRFRSAGVADGDVDGVADLGKLPITTKTDLQSAGAENRIDGRALGQELVGIQTSGSTGRPFQFWIDPVYDQYRKAQYLRAQLMAGRRIFDRVLRLSDVDPDWRGHARPASNGWFRRAGLLREYHLFPDTDVVAQYRELARLEPQVLHGYGSSLALIAAYARENGEPLHSPRIVITDSELLTDDHRQTIESAFQAPVRDIYGTYETDNIAYQCPVSGLYHITAESVVLEIVDGAEPVPVGEPGEVVCTVLHNLVSPFIRYKLGDVASLSTERCACGSPFPGLRMLEGRSDDYAIDPTGRKVSPRSLLARFDELTGSVREYRIRQLAPERFIVTLVPTKAYGPETREKIQANFHELFPAAEVSIETAEHLERGTSGKLRAFSCDIDR